MYKMKELKGKYHSFRFSSTNAQIITISIVTIILPANIERVVTNNNHSNRRVLLELFWMKYGLLKFVSLNIIENSECDQWNTEKTKSESNTMQQL